MNHPTKEDLERLRARVDEIDEALVAQLGRRFGLTRQIGALKAAGGLPATDADRQRRQDERLAGLAVAHGVAPGLVQQVFDDIRAQVCREHDELRLDQDVGQRRGLSQ